MTAGVPGVVYADPNGSGVLDSSLGTFDSRAGRSTSTATTLLNRTVEVVVIGSSVKSISGLALDGRGDDHPGSNFVGPLSARLAGRRSLASRDLHRPAR